jgi:putative membrane protein
MNLPNQSLAALGLGLALTFALTARAQTQMTDDKAAPATSDATMSGPTTTASTAEAAGMVPHGDKAFVLAVAEGSNQEVALSQLAVSQASSQEVKDFAQQMITDHSALNARLADLAARKGIDLTEAVAKGRQQGVEALAKKMGTDFDQAYIKDMVKGHDGTVKGFKKEVAKGKDTDIQAFATANVAMIEQHDAHAHRLAQATP